MKKQFLKIIKYFMVCVAFLATTALVYSCDEPKKPDSRPGDGYLSVEK
jgi:hypothetical protein